MRAGRSVALVTAIGLAVAQACGGGGGSTTNAGSTGPNTPAPTPVVTTVTVSLAPSAILVGQSATATSAARDQFGASIATGTIAWSSSTPSVASVTAAGIVTGVGAGQAVISASAGGVTGSASLTVTAANSLAECKLPAKFSDIGLGLPRSVNRQRSTGDVRVAMVFVDFADAVATRTPQNVFGLISPSAENYYKAVSYGRMNLILEPSFVWRRMSKPTTDYGWNGLTFANHRAYIQEALNLVGTSVDFSSDDAFVIVSNPDAGALSNGPAFVSSPGFGVTAGGRTFLNGSTSGRDLLVWGGGFWLAHEMGHTMGLADLYAFAGATHRFVGGFSMMGLISGQAREYFGWERWLLGWIDDAQVTCAQPGTSEVVLTPVERTGGTKIVVVPTGPTTAVVAESRRSEGFDANGPFTQGVVVYFIDTSIASGNGVLKVLPINDNDVSKGTAPLGVGGSITFNGVTIRVLSTDATGDRVQVVR